MAAKFVLAACLVACVRAGDLLQQPLPLAASAPFAQIRYASAAPILTKSTIYHAAPAPAPIAYHATAPAQLAYHATAPASIAYHSQPAPILSYQTIAPTIASYAPSPLVRSVASGPTLVRSVAHHAPALIRTIAAAAPAPTPALIKSQPIEDYDPNPQYSFGYDIQDTLTGDIKSQSETRNGDLVQGSYALNEPDGTRRIVDYSADSINGFNAVVRKEPLLQKAILEPAPVRIAAPALRLAPSEPWAQTYVTH